MSSAVYSKGEGDLSIIYNNNEWVNQSKVFPLITEIIIIGRSTEQEWIIISTFRFVWVYIRKYLININGKELVPNTEF